MSFISRCTLFDLAGRTDPLEIKLNRHVNVFFGSNGSGKTTLLKFLHSALLNDSKQLSKIPVSGGSVQISEAMVVHPEWLVDEQEIVRTVQYDHRLLLSDIEFGSKTAERSHKATKKVWESTSDLDGSEDVGQSIDHIFLPITRLYASEDGKSGGSLRRHLSGSSSLSEVDLDKMFVDSVTFLWLRYTRNLLSEVRSAQEAGLSKILLNVLLPEAQLREAPAVDNPKRAYQRLISFLSRQDTNSLLDFFDEADFLRRLEDSGLMRSVVSQIEDVEQKVERAQRPRNQFERLIKEMIRGNKKVELGYQDISLETKSGLDLGLETLSSGEKQLLRICLEALFAGDNPIIIDEPELSMHIDWQRKFVKSIRQLSPHSQIIIATHSPEIMADLAEESIFEL